MSKKEAEGFIQSLRAKAEKGTKNIEDKINALIEKTLKASHIPSRDEINNLENRIKSLENKISLVPGLIDDVTEKNFDAATSILVMQFLPDDGTKLNFLTGISERLKPGAPIVLVDLEGKIGSDEYNTLNAAWENQQLFIRGDNDRVRKEFIIREKEVHFIPQERIESLLQEAGFYKICKFFKAYLFGGYAAIKR